MSPDYAPVIEKLNQTGETKLAQTLARHAEARRAGNIEEAIRVWLDAQPRL